jgi:hypothetical protein
MLSVPPLLPAAGRRVFATWREGSFEARLLPQLAGGESGPSSIKPLLRRSGRLRARADIQAKRFTPQRRRPPCDMHGGRNPGKYMPIAQNIAVREAVYAWGRLEPREHVVVPASFADRRIRLARSTGEMLELSGDGLGGTPVASSPLRDHGSRHGCRTWSILTAVRRERGLALDGFLGRQPRARTRPLHPRTACRGGHGPRSPVRARPHG